MLDITTNVAASGYEVYNDPSSAPFAIVGLMGARGFRSTKDFRNMAQKRHVELPDAGVLGKGFKEQDDGMKESVDLTCA